jgi:hypothetical protein
MHLIFKLKENFKHPSRFFYVHVISVRFRYKHFNVIHVLFNAEIFIISRFLSLLWWQVVSSIMILFLTCILSYFSWSGVCAFLMHPAPAKMVSGANITSMKSYLIYKLCVIMSNSILIKNNFFQNCYKNR